MPSAATATPGSQPRLFIQSSGIFRYPPSQSDVLSGSPRTRLPDSQDETRVRIESDGVDAPSRRHRNQCAKMVLSDSRPSFVKRHKNDAADAEAITEAA